MQTWNRKTYDIDADIMRIIAAFGVVMIHATDLNTNVKISLNAISRFSVPVFVMLSGYYMLMHKVNGKQVAKKCVKLFSMMIVWSVIYYGYDIICGVRRFTGIPDLLTYILTEPVHLWYLYATIILYLFTPLLFVFCENATRKEYLYALLLTFSFGSIIVMALRSGYMPVLSIVIDRMKVPYTLGFVFLFLSGGYLQRYEIERNIHKYIIYLLGILGIIISITGTILLSSDGAANDFCLSFYSPNVMMEGVAFFVFVKVFLQKHPIKSEKISIVIREISGCTPGIYLMHPLILMILQSTDLFSQTWIASILKAIIGFMFSTIIVMIIRKIPLVKWTIG